MLILIQNISVELTSDFTCAASVGVQLCGTWCQGNRRETLLVRLTGKD